MTRILRREFVKASLLASGTVGAFATSIHAARAESGANGSSSTLGAASTRRRHPNVLWISADDLGCTLGCYNDKRVHSPRIDAFADEAAIFFRAFCQIAVCTASRTSIMTGTRPETTGLWTLEHDFRATLPQQKTIPQHFANHGYETHSLGKVFDPRSGPGNAEGWVSMRHEWGIESADDALLQMEELAQLPEDKPWFFAVGFKQPHCPWEPSEESRKLYPPEELTLQGNGRRFESEYLQKCSGANREVVDHATAYDILGRYFGEVTDFDREFGRIYDKARVLGFLDNTIIICWSGDHGYQLSENDRWGKWTNYIASTRIPLIIKFPNMPHPGSRIKGIVEAVDMYATLCELCGLAPPEHHEGQSFSPLLRDPSRPGKRAAFSIWEDQSRSIKTRTHNLIVHDRPPDGATEGAATRELYNYAEDFFEEHNIANEQPELLEELEAMLDAGPAALIQKEREQVFVAVCENEAIPAQQPPGAGGCASCEVGRAFPRSNLTSLSALGLVGLLALWRRSRPARHQERGSSDSTRR